MNSIAEKKKALRKEYLERRQSLSMEEWREQSASIMQRALQLPELRDARQVLCYVSSKDNEVNTLDLINALLARGCQVAVPRILADVRLEWRCISDINQLTRARFGILEPTHDICPLFEHPEDAEVCIVPGIAWDTQGHRIGYGIGFFDRFLSVFNGTSIGLAFDSQVLPSLPHDTHDVPVTCLITQTQVMQTSPKRI